MWLMTNINSCAVNRGMGTWVGEIGGGSITSIDGASVVIIANGGDVCVDTAS